MGALTPKEKVEWLVKHFKKQFDQRPQGCGVAKFVRQFKVFETYQKEFKDNRSRDAIRLWVSKILNVGNSIKGQKGEFIRPRSSSKDPLKVFLRSNYIVIAPPNFINGFETEEEVKEFLKQSQILGGIKLFQVRPVNIEFNIKIG